MNKRVLLLSTIIVTYNLLWDLFYLTIEIERVHQALLRLSGLIVGSMVLVTAYVAILIFFSRGKYPNIKKHETLMILFFFGMSFVGIVIGLIYGNNIFYIVGDTYKLLLVPVIYLLTLRLTSKEDISTVFGVLIFTVAVSLFFDVVFVFPSLLREFVRIEDHFWINNVLAFGFIAAYVRYGRINLLRTLYLSSFAFIAALASFFSFHRTILVVLPFILLLSLQKSKTFLRNSVAMLIGICILGLVAGGSLLVKHGEMLAAGLNVASDYFVKRTETSFDLIGESSTASKVEEIRAAIKNLNKFKLNWVLGRGSGAEYHPTAYQLAVSPGVRRSMEKLQTDKIHHIHNLHFAILYRYGLVGFVIFLAMLIQLGLFLRVSWRTSGYQLINYTTYIYYLSSLLIMFVFPLFLGDLNFGVLLGLVQAIRDSDQITKTNYEY